MQFCKICENVLLPKKNSDELYCRVCKKSFPINDKEKNKLEQYKKAKKKKNLRKIDKKRALRTAVISESKKKKSMTEDEREAYGELLEMSGD